MARHVLGRVDVSTRVLPVLVLAFALLGTAGCASTTIGSGHRGVLFSPDIGTHHEILYPGVHRLHSGESVAVFDVRYARHDERVRAYTPDGHVVDARITVVYRPVIAELYQLDTEIGADYYAKIIAPEARDATRAVLETRPPEGAVAWRGSELEQLVEVAVRRRTAGRHVEIVEVMLDDVEYTPPPLGY